MKRLNETIEGQAVIIPIRVPDELKRNLLKAIPEGETISSVTRAFWQSLIDKPKPKPKRKK